MAQTTSRFSPVSYRAPRLAAFDIASNDLHEEVNRTEPSPPVSVSGFGRGKHVQHSLLMEQNTEKCKQLSELRKAQYGLPPH